MNPQTLQLLEKALEHTPDHWETRAHLIIHFLKRGESERATALLAGAVSIPETEKALLLKARVELEMDPAKAEKTLQGVLGKNRACAAAYVLWARVFQRRGLREEALRKYGAATVIDEKLRAPDLERWLGIEEERAAADERMPSEFSPLEGLDVSEAETQAALRALAEPGFGERPELTFEDIGGMGGVIERLQMSLVYPFHHPEIFRRFNRSPCSGTLLYGPPGCGKTQLARATAGECGAAFVEVPLGEILCRWPGETAERLHECFMSARRQRPSLIFLDEIDALIGAKLETGEPLLAVLLAELDANAEASEAPMVLAATNAPWRIDHSLRRPGRFERVIFVPPPDCADREAILEICLRELPAEILDLTAIAGLTHRFSGADLCTLVERAAEKAILEEICECRPAKLSQAMMEQVARQMRPSTLDWLETARGYASYANRSGCYDDLATFFERE